MYRNIQLKTAQYKVTCEQLNYHSKVTDEEVNRFIRRGPIDPQRIPNDFETLVVDGRYCIALLCKWVNVAQCVAHVYLSIVVVVSNLVDQ